MRTNIPIYDILTFKEERNSSRQLLQQHYAPVKKEIMHRYADTIQRIGSTTDTTALQKLDSFEKFLRAISEQFDLQWIFIDDSTASFNGIDDSYWNFVFNNEKLKQENQFLKSTIASMTKQRDLVVNGWRYDRDQWYKDRTIKKNIYDINRQSREI